MTKKKENRFLEFLLTYGWAFLVIIIMVGVLAYFGIIKSPIDYYCSKSSDKCVCENWKYYLDKEKRCSDFRYKSQAELDIDDCNNNPREDEKCKLIILENQTISKEELFLNNEEFFKIVKCFNNHSCYKVKSRPKNQCELNNADFKEDVAYFGEIPDEETQRQVGYYNCRLDEKSTKEIYVCNRCIEKKEWEKHPEDYVAETECVEYEGYSSQTCRNQTFEICYDDKPKLKTEICNDLRNKTFEQCFGGGCLNCTDICIRNSTTYRLKNECEKKNYYRKSNDGKYYFYFCKNVSSPLVSPSDSPLLTPEELKSKSDCDVEYKIINPDWVEEINISESDYDYINHSIWWHCDFSYHFNKEYKSTQQEIDYNIERCIFYKEKFKKLNKTICREKTDVEKLMDKNCDELRYWIYEARCLSPVFPGHGCGYTKRDKELRENYNKAFIKKGCEE